MCFDPFHVVQLGSKATDQVRRAEYNKHGRSGSDTGKWIKGVRYSLLKDPAKQTTKQLLRLCEVQQTNKPMFRAALLYGELRYIYKVPKEQATERLEAWLAWASRSRLKPFVKLARTIRKHKAGVLAAVELGISNGRLEALNSKVRLLSHRAYGFHSADALIAMIYLCCAGITIALPHRDREARETGERLDRFLVLVGERSPARLFGQVQAPVRHVVNEDRDAEKRAHRRMSGRHSVTVRVLAEVGKAQRDRIEDQIAEHAAAARPLADPRARVIVDPRREKYGEAVPGIVEHAQRRVLRAGQLLRGLQHSIKRNLQPHLVEHELAGVRHAARQ